MAESLFVPLVGATVVAIGLATAVFVLYARNRPALMRGPLAVSVSILGMTAGVAVLLVGEAAHGAGSLVYVGGVVALIGVGALTGVVAAVPHPEGEDAEAAH